MTPFDKRSQIKGVAARWKARYGDGKYKLYGGRLAGDVHAALLSLDPERSTPEDVARVIGNSSWCAPQTCNECNSESWDCVQIGEEPNYESATAMVCLGCLKAAIGLLEGITGEGKSNE